MASLFDDVLAWQDTVGDGITEGSLVPFQYLGLKNAVLTGLQGLLPMPTC